MAAKKPYPGYPPTYKVVEETGGYRRSCFVLEVLTLGPLDNAQFALIQEQLELVAARLQKLSSVVERVEVVTPDRFDPLLREGLRLS